MCNITSVKSSAMIAGVKNIFVYHPIRLRNTARNLRSSSADLQQRKNKENKYQCNSSEKVKEVVTEEKPVDQTSESSKEEVKGEVVTPSIFNRPWVRIVSVVSALAFAAKSTNPDFITTNINNFVHLASFSGWFGSSLWVILLSPKIMFTNLGRQTFGKLQTKLFTQYFGFSTAMLIVLLGTSPYDGFPVPLGLSLAITAVNWLFVEPAISSMALQRYGMENAEVRDKEAISELMKKTSKLHGFSSLLALVSLGCSFAYAWSLSSKLVF